MRQRASQIVSSTDVHPVRWTRQQFDRLAECGVLEDDPRIELLGGELIQMPPIGTAHCLVVTALQAALAEANADGRLLVQQPLVLGDEDEPQPDLVVLRERVRGRKAAAADCLVVIEVSDTTLRRDRDDKLPRYLRAGVPEVWIVAIEARQIEVYRNAALVPSRVARGPDFVLPDLSADTLFADLG
jgi:Uma2 family endonuclease